jgi:hypothetical protein
MRNALVLCVALALGSCAMAESVPINRMNLLGCETDSGAYYLSKTHLEVTVERVKLVDATTKEVAGVFNRIRGITEKRKPDRRHGFCLDYLASPTADEKVYIQKDDKYLLKLISTQAIDQSAYILKNIINAIFIGISSGAGQDFRGLTSGLEEVVDGIAFRAQYDPFDPSDSAFINASLTELGFCLVLENRTFDPNQETIDSYCSNPGGHGRLRPGAAFKPEDAPAQAIAETGSRGILYRPLLPYNYYLFVKQGGGGKRWKLRHTQVVKLENVSPIISVGIDRSFFANRRSALLFNEGALKNICIYKSSELLEVSTIPLAIANNMAALPTNILQLKIDNSNNFRELAAAEDQLIAAQLRHLEVLKDLEAAQSSPESLQAARAAYTAPVVEANVRKTAIGLDEEEWGAICPNATMPTGIGGLTASTSPTPGFLTTLNTQ